MPPSRAPSRMRSRSPPGSRRRSRSPSFRTWDSWDTSSGPYNRRRSPPRRFSPRRDERRRSPPTTWRPRSPRLESRPSSPGARPPAKRPRESSPPSRDSRPPRWESFSSPDVRRTSNSPFRGGVRRESGSRMNDFSGPPRSPRGKQWESWPDTTPRGSPPRRGPRPGAIPTGPSHNSFERSDPVASANATTRSPVHQSRYAPYHRERPTRAETEPRVPAWSTPGDSVRTWGPSTTWGPPSAAEKEKGPSKDGFRATESQRSHFPNPGVSQAFNNTSNQTTDRPASNVHLPPSGPSHGLKPSQNSGNISMLSAPTRPRASQSFRNSISPVTTPLRQGPMHGLAPTAPLGPVSSPSGPRANMTPTPANEASRPYRQNNPIPHHHHHQYHYQPRGPRFMNYLGDLLQVIPGGKLLSFNLDPASKKRISHLESDKEKLMEQHIENQKSKRLRVKEWDQVDRECQVSILKSELADGHLRQMEMAEGSMRADALF